jgi:hypothetical protein
MKEEYSPERRKRIEMENTLNGEVVSDKVSFNQSPPH